MQGRVLIANVHEGRHFVLATGLIYNSTSTANALHTNRKLLNTAEHLEQRTPTQENDEALLLVNDPGFQVTNYSLSSDVVGWRIFDMQ